MAGGQLTGLKLSHQQGDGGRRGRLRPMSMSIKLSDVSM